MRLPRALAVAGALALLVPAAAHAGTASWTAASITYAGAASDDEDVTFRPEAGQIAVESPAHVSNGGGCSVIGADQVDCPLAPALVATMQGKSTVDASAVTTATLTAQGGPRDDDLRGTPNADSLAGGDGDDSLTGNAGDDTLDGGIGADYFYDGAGNDKATGGAGGDTFHAGPGTDIYDGGDGSDSISYDDRSAPVTVKLDGLANDGEAGENDNVISVEDVTGGAGNDTIVGDAAGDRLHGGPGNDTIVGGPAEDRIEGQEGDDVIDSRDGRFDSIDCGPGNDVVYGDPEDSTTNCEVAPDPDGDGYIAPADCAPNNPAVHPGAPEIYGNPVDENCDGIAAYLRVIAPISYRANVDRKHSSVVFTRLVVQEIEPNDTIELRCSGKGCPFKRKTQVGRRGKATVNLLPLLKRRSLGKGARLEVRVLRANQIGRVQRFTVGKRGKLTSTGLCLNVGATSPTSCT